MNNPTTPKETTKSKVNKNFSILTKSCIYVNSIIYNLCCDIANFFLLTINLNQLRLRV